MAKNHYKVLYWSPYYLLVFLWINLSVSWWISNKVETLYNSEVLFLLLYYYLSINFHMVILLFSYEQVTMWIEKTTVPEKLQNTRMTHEESMNGVKGHLSAKWIPKLIVQISPNFNYQVVTECPLRRKHRL